MEKVWGEHEVSNCTCVYVGEDGRVSALLHVRRAVKANKLWMAKELLTIICTIKIVNLVVSFSDLVARK